MTQRVKPSRSQSLKEMIRGWQKTIVLNMTPESLSELIHVYLLSNLHIFFLLLGSEIQRLQVLGEVREFIEEIYNCPNKYFTTLIG